MNRAARRISEEWRKKTLLESRISQAYKTNVCNYIKYISKLFKNFTQVALLQKRSVRIFASTYAAVQSARKNIAPFRVKGYAPKWPWLQSLQPIFQLRTFTVRVRSVRHNLKDVGYLDTLNSQRADVISLSCKIPIQTGYTSLQQIVSYCHQTAKWTKCHTAAIRLPYIPQHILSQQALMAVKSITFKKRRHCHYHLSSPRVRHFLIQDFRILEGTRLKCGPGSSVGIATDCGLDSPGSNLGGDEIFRPSSPALGLTQPRVKWVPGLSRG